MPHKKSRSSGKAKSRKTSKKVKDSNLAVSKNSPSGIKQVKKTTKPKRKKEVNLDNWIEKYIDKIVSLTGLELLGLTHEQYIDLLRDIIVQLYGSTTSYTKAEIVAKRFMRYSERVYPIIASRLTVQLNRFNPTQLEFIVYHIGDSILGLAPKIYAEVKKARREDLLQILRNKWANAWLKNKLPILPVECPKCGFNALMPDLSCLVCSANVSEKEVKERMNFKEVFIEFINSLTCEQLSDLVRYDYVLVNGLGLKHPKEKRAPIDVEIYLSRVEREIVRKKYLSKCTGDVGK